MGTLSALVTVIPSDYQAWPVEPVVEDIVQSTLEEIAVIAASVAHFRRLELASARTEGSAPGGARSSWKWAGRDGWRR